MIIRVFRFDNEDLLVPARAEMGELIGDGLVRLPKNSALWMKWTTWLNRTQSVVGDAEKYMELRQDDVGIRKAKVAYHEHDGWQEHPVSVKHHQEYFSSQKVLGTTQQPTEADETISTKVNIRSMRRYFESHGIKVNSDNTVTLYHASPKADEIEREGRFKAGAATYTEGKPAVWFAPSKEDVAKWAASRTYKVLEVKVPVEALKHPPQDFNQLFVVGDLVRDKNNIWKPVLPVPETWHNRVAFKDFGWLRDKPRDVADVEIAKADEDMVDAYTEEIYDWVDSTLEKAGLPIPGGSPQSAKKVGKNIEYHLYSTLRDAVNDYLKSLTGAEFEADVIRGVQDVLRKWEERNILAADAAFLDLFAKGFAAGAVAAGVDKALSPADMSSLNVLKDGKYRIGERIKLFADDAVKDFAGIIHEAYEPKGLLDLDIMVSRMNEKVPDMRYKLERVARTETSSVSMLGRLYGWSKDPDKYFYNYNWRPFHDERVREMKLIRERGNSYSFPEIVFLWTHNEQMLPNGKFQNGNVNCRCGISRSPRDDEFMSNRFEGQEAQFRKTVDFII